MTESSALTIKDGAPRSQIHDPRLSKSPQKCDSYRIGPGYWYRPGVRCTILTARYLGVYNFGRFNFFFGVAFLFWFIGEAGLMNILVRELSRRLEDWSNIILAWGLFRGLVFCFCAGLSGVTGIFLLLGPVDGELKKIVSSRSLHSVHVSGLTLASVVRAHEDLEYYALGFSLKHLFLLAAIYLVTYLDAGFVATILAYASAYVFLWAYYHLLVRWRYGIPPIRFNLSNSKHLLRESFPLGIGQVLRRTANYVDIFVLGPPAAMLIIGYFPLLTVSFWSCREPRLPSVFHFYRSFQS